MGKRKQVRLAAYPNPWPVRVSLEDAFHFAHREFALHLDGFKACILRRDPNAAAGEIKFLRGIVDKTDTFRRIMARQWADEDADKLEQKGVAT